MEAILNFVEAILSFVEAILCFVEAILIFVEAILNLVKTKSTPRFDLDLEFDNFGKYVRIFIYELVHNGMFFRG